MEKYAPRIIIVVGVDEAKMGQNLLTRMGECQDSTIGQCFVSIIPSIWSFPEGITTLIYTSSIDYAPHSPLHSAVILTGYEPG